MIGFAVACCTEAKAQVLCGPHEDVVSRLKERFEETRHAYGLISEKAIVEVYVSGKGTWTMIVISPDGRACMVASGHSWTETGVLPGKRS